MLFLFLAVLAAMAVGALLGFIIGSMLGANKGIAALYGATGCALITGLAIFIPGIGITIRRFHDRDMSGWWYLGVIVLGVGIWIFMPFLARVPGIVMTVLFCFPGTNGPNRFGPDPLRPGTADVFA
jgi:uncharacterized membrane protein YhaH (DUF805 family)